MNLNTIEKIDHLLKKNRSKLLQELVHHYNYSQLITLFESLNKTGEDKYVYNLLLGKVEDNFPISSIPSREFVLMIGNLADYFHFTKIECFCVESGIFPLLLKREYPQLDIVPCEKSKCSENFVFTPQLSIAQRTATEYKYYDTLNLDYPDMVIYNYHEVSRDITEEKQLFHYCVNTISNILSLQKVKIFIVILPIVYTSIYDLLHYLRYEGSYHVISHYAKIVGKYYFLRKLFEDRYPSDIKVHMLISKDILPSVDLIRDMIELGTIPAAFDDNRCCYYKQMFNMYTYYSDNLLADIRSRIRFEKKIQKSFFEMMINSIRFLKKHKIDVPLYIENKDEFKLWMMCMAHRVFILFENREQFLTYYQKCREETSFPEWLPDNTVDKYKYLYLTIVKKTEEWAESRQTFYNEWKKINLENSKIILKK